MGGLSAVISAAGVGNPWERAAEVTEADPVAVAALAGRYREAAEHAGTAVRAAERADRTTAAGYVVDGVAVHQAAAATAATRTARGDGGEHAGEVARMFGVVAGELGRVKTGVGAEITALDRQHNIAVTVAGPPDQQIRGDDDSGFGDLARWGLGNL